MEYLYNKLIQYGSSDYYGFHMPGHKRSRTLTGAELPYKIDITEIDGFDDLHHARGILKEAQERAAKVYQADETHYLINGSTAGLLSAVLGCTRRGDCILMARNCHKSVYNAVFLNGLHPVYLYPEDVPGTEMNGEIAVEQVERLLNDYPDIQAVVITSPTYDGVVSDVRQIAEAAHKRNIPLILDEAHGAHLGFHSYFPENGNQCGADLVIHSLHKTLPALTQTALLHMNGDIINRRQVRRYLHILQSSSPSYVLMAGIDECIRMLEEKGEEVFAQYTVLLDRARKQLQELRHMKLMRTERYDPSKLVISVKDTMLADSGEIFTGRDLYQCLLENYHLQAEMAAGSYVILMTSPADSQAGLKRLISALYEIDQKLAVRTCAGTEPGYSKICASLDTDTDEREISYIPDIQKTAISQKMVYSSFDAEEKRTEGSETVRWEEAEGRIALEYTYLYPPGIPLIVPGERISARTVKQIGLYEKMGFEIEGTEHKGQIEVLAHG